MCEKPIDHADFFDVTIKKKRLKSENVTKFQNSL